MRQNPNLKRPRGRGPRRGQNPRSHTLDSNGPSVRIRGNAIQIYEKYQQLARDASSGGDRVVAENLLQHAEHYFRLAGANGHDPRRRPNGNADGVTNEDPQPDMVAGSVARRPAEAPEAQTTR